MFKMDELIRISYIPVNTELAIFDLFDTLIIEPIERSDIWEVRIGFKEVIDHLLSINSKAAICSDISIERVKEKLGWGLPYIQETMMDRFIGIYDEDNQISIDGSLYKNLGAICEAESVNPSKALMCGDDHLGKDSRSSRKYNVPFLLVPNGRDDPSFSLENIIWK